MTGHDDDLSPWNDDPLVRALRAPGSDDELAGESEFLAAFRAAQPAAGTAHPTGRGRLRLVGRRLGGGGTAVVVAVALGAGAAAAAYTQNLPDPVQRAVHGVLGPVGVPAPEKPQADRTPSSPGSGGSAPDREQSATDDPTTDPTTEAPTEKPSDDPTDKPSDSPSSDPSESPSPTETPSETPTSAPPVAPAAVSGAGTSHRATPDESVAFSGTVTDAAGAAVAGQQVDLLQRQGPAWTPVGAGTTDTSGLVSISAPALTRTSVFRLGIGDQLASEPWRVVLVPTVSMAPDGGSVVVTARGAQPGDQVSLFSKRPGPDVLIARSRLAEDLTTSFRAPAARKPVTLVALLPRTRAHAVARTSLRVVPPDPTSMTASVPDTTPGPDDTVVVSGTVSSDGVALPGRQVWLILREVGWRLAPARLRDQRRRRLGVHRRGPDRRQRGRAAARRQGTQPGRPPAAAARVVDHCHARRAIGRDRRPGPRSAHRRPRAPAHGGRRRPDDGRRVGGRRGRLGPVPGAASREAPGALPAGPAAHAHPPPRDDRGRRPGGHSLSLPMDFRACAWKSIGC